MFTAEALSRVSGVQHGFFSRRGGVSEGPFASLNCGFGSGDDAANVVRNRARAVAELGLPGRSLVTVYQTHTSEVVEVTEAWQPARAPKADAMVTRRSGVALGVLSADCAPVLFADAGARVIGAAHAGWRGALSGIVEATVEAMRGLGAREIVAAVGPCIAQDSYEVGPEFRARFVAGDGESGDFFVPSEREDRYRFDLAGYIGRRLAALSVEAVETLSFDTCADADTFFSYRRATLEGKKDYGRGLSAVALDGS